MTQYMMSRLPLCVFILLVTGPAFLVGKNMNEVLLKNIILDAEFTFDQGSVDVNAFRVDWYNEMVPSRFDLSYANDTVGITFFTIPNVFENSFIPFLCENNRSVAKNSWSKFIRAKMEMVRQELNAKYHLGIPQEDMYYGFHRPDGRVRILVQRSGHVAGGAYYYQRKDVKPDAWAKNETIYGVSIHPLYGGYFSLDAVIILRNCLYPGMKYKKPKDVVKGRKKKIEMLNIVNTDWRNSTWREMFPITRKYTQEHMDYVYTYGPEREVYVRYLIKKYCTRTTVFPFFPTSGYFWGTYR